MPAAHGRPSGGGRKTVALVLAAAGSVLIAILIVSLLYVKGVFGGSASPTPTASRQPQVPATWLSGASSDQAADGSFGTWRGTPLAIGGTWDNGNAEQVAMRSICPRGSWADWDKPLDVAVGAIDVDAGESWKAAGEGAYIDRWRANLTRVKECWGARDPALLYIRFAHEMNLQQKWRVHGGEEGDFVKAITLYSDLRYEILPKANLVLCPNDGTNPALGGLDIRKLWPGKDDQGRLIANIYAVDSYNSSPHVTTESQFAKKIDATQSNGAPLGLEQHRKFAEQQGVPFAVAEWSNNGDTGAELGGGESPLYVRLFHDWVKAHAGDPTAPRPGQLLYEVQFNLFKQYAFWPDTIQPETAGAYKDLTWGK